MGKKNKEIKEKNKNVISEVSVKIPRTVQESIPYLRVYENGIIETEKGTYSKSYLLTDVNFQIASQEEQQNIFLAYSDFLNMFPSEVSVQVSINNRNIDIEDFKKKVLIAPQNDNLNELREEYNEMLLKKMQENVETKRSEMLAKIDDIQKKADELMALAKDPEALAALEQLPEFIVFEDEQPLVQNPVVAAPTEPEKPASKKGSKKKKRGKSPKK